MPKRMDEDLRKYLKKVVSEFAESLLILEGGLFCKNENDEKNWVAEISIIKDNGNGIKSEMTLEEMKVLVEEFMADLSGYYVYPDGSIENKYG